MPRISSSKPQAPNFARHPNVQEEQIVQQKVLIKIVEDSFDQAYKESKQTKNSAHWLPLYDKVGGFYGWSYPDFMNTPYSVIKAANSKIDEKLENIDSGSFLHWPQVFVMMAISKCFGGQS